MEINKKQNVLLVDKTEQLEPMHKVYVNDGEFRQIELRHLSQALPVSYQEILERIDVDPDDTLPVAIGKIARHLKDLDEHSYMSLVSNTDESELGKPLDAKVGHDLKQLIDTLTINTNSQNQEHIKKEKEIDTKLNKIKNHAYKDLVTDTNTTITGQPLDAKVANDLKKLIDKLTLTASDRDESFQTQITENKTKIDKVKDYAYKDLVATTTATETGSPLDATIGKQLKDEINALSSNTSSQNSTTKEELNDINAKLSKIKPYTSKELATTTDVEVTGQPLDAKVANDIQKEIDIISGSLQGKTAKIEEHTAHLNKLKPHTEKDLIANTTTSVTGSPLDATIGKKLKDEINTISSELDKLIKSIGNDTVSLVDKINKIKSFAYLDLANTRESIATGKALDSSMFAVLDSELKKLSKVIDARVDELRAEVDSEATTTQKETTEQLTDIKNKLTTLQSTISQCKNITDNLQSYTSKELADNLTTAIKGQPLDATQGRILKSKIDSNADNLNKHQRHLDRLKPHTEKDLISNTATTITGNPLDAVVGKKLKDEIDGLSAAISKLSLSSATTEELDKVKNRLNKLRSFAENDLATGVDVTIPGTALDAIVGHSLNEEIKKVDKNLKNQIGKLKTIEITVVDSLPFSGESNKIYLKPKYSGKATNNSYDEYLWTGSKFEKIGDTDVDLSPFVKTTDIVNNLTTGGTNKPLSAEQGKKLDQAISSLQKMSVSSPNGIHDIRYYNDTLQVKSGNKWLDLEKNYKTMTVKIDQKNSNPATRCTYADDAVGMLSGEEEWDDFFGHYPCILKDGKEIGKLDRNDFSKWENGNVVDIFSRHTGDVMIAFPRLGLKIETSSDNIVTVSMTNEPNKKGYKYLAHSCGEKVIDKFYLGAFLGCLKDGKLRSLIWEKPALQNMKRSRTLAQSNGNGYSLIGFYQLLFVQSMYVLKYKNTNSQEAIGRGRSDDNLGKVTYEQAVAQSGETVNKGMDYGETTGKKFMKFAGLENLWGNVYYWIDGIVTDNKGFYKITNDTHRFNSLGNNYETIIDTSSFDHEGYITEVIGTTESGFLIKKSNSSGETIHYCDYTYNLPNCVARFGGNWDNGSSSGIFKICIDYSNDNEEATFASRLMYMP